MNTILIIVIVLLLFGVLNGLRKGLIRAIFSTFILFASLAIASYVGPSAAKFLKGTSIYDTVYQKVEPVLAGQIETEVTDKIGGQIEAINKLPLPESIKKGMLDNNNSEIYQVLGINSFVVYAADYVTMLIINASAYIIVFIVAYILLKLLEMVLDGLAELPILNGMNRVGGAIFGAFNGIMGIWVFCIILTAFATTSWGMEAFEQINQSQLLTFIYNHNYLVEIIKNISKILF